MPLEARCNDFWSPLYLTRSNINIGNVSSVFICLYLTPVLVSVDYKTMLLSMILGFILTPNRKRQLTPVSLKSLRFEVWVPIIVITCKWSHMREQPLKTRQPRGVYTLLFQEYSHHWNMPRIERMYRFVFHCSIYFQISVLPGDVASLNAYNYFIEVQSMQLYKFFFHLTLGSFWFINIFCPILWSSV